MRGWWWLVVVVVALGCSGRSESEEALSDGADAGDGGVVLDAQPPSPDARPSTCPFSWQPVIDECDTGRFFANCGGDGEPVLGCAHGDCRWFTGGCAARGYEVSPCPSDDICCFTLRNGRWPFQERTSNDSYLFFDLYGWGTLPWTRARAMNVSVVVDEALPVGDRVFTCDGPEPHFGGPCGVLALGMSQGPVRDTISFTVYGRPGLAGWNPTVEIDPVTMKARVCADRYTDFFSGCPTGQDVVCAHEGTLTLSRLPASGLDFEDLRLRLDVRLSELRLEVAF